MVELADIFRRHGSTYRAKYGNRILSSHRRAMRAIEQCRTEALGGHVYACAQCDETLYSYHSCKNRHCPKCQHDAAQDWLARQQDLLLPVPYFMLTCTLPASLRDLARGHQKLVYNLLFRASAAATQQLAHDPRFVGGQIAMVGVLHTWARDLSYHPHVHYLAPAGGLSADGATWLAARDTFLLPAKALSILFRAKFREALKQTTLFEQVPKGVWREDWVVHCQPVGRGVGALKYLAPYIFRVALSNNRILQATEETVTFRYTPSGRSKSKTCTLPVEAFMHRFLQHVLPKGFVKVRYYGLFSPAQRPLLARARQLLGGATTPQQESEQSAPAPAQAPTPRCPLCGQKMVLRETLRRRSRHPP